MFNKSERISPEMLNGLAPEYVGSSGIQEINGWTRPTEYPIRNDKADKAIKILGYKLD